MKSKLFVLFAIGLSLICDLHADDDEEKVDVPWWVYFNPYDLNMQKGKFDLCRARNFTIEIPAQIDDDQFYFYSFMTISNGAVVTQFRSGLKKTLEKIQANMMSKILLNYYRELTKHFHDRLGSTHKILHYEINEFNRLWLESHPGYIERIICGELTCSRIDGYVNKNPFAKIDDDVDRLNRNIGNDEN